MSELELSEPENFIRLLTFLIVVAVFLVTAVAYYRTRISRLVVVALIAALIASDLVVEIGDEFLEEGIPNFELLTSLLTLGIGLLLLVTLLRRFEWQPP